MEIHVLKLRQTVSTSVAVRLICCLVVLSVYSTALEVESWSSVQVLVNGPVVNVVCKATFPAGQTGYTITWSVDGNYLFVNDLKIDHASPRYSVSYMEQSQNSRIFTSAISINNAVKQDEGAYECLAQYIQDNNMISAMDTIDVFIPQYLPAQNYPECMLESQDGFNTDNFLTFTCITGDSNPSVTLQLTLNQTDGSQIPIGLTSNSGNASATVTVPDSNGNVTFVCSLTSSLFTTANRICSVTFSPEDMPSTNTITILPTKNQSTNSDSNAVTSQITVNKMMTSNGAVNMVKASTWGIVGGVIGAFVTAVTFIIIILLMKRHYNRSKPSGEHENNSSSTSNLQPATDDPYSGYLTPNSKAYTSSNQTNVPPPDQQSSDHPYTPYKKQPDPEPYATLNQISASPESDQQSPDHPYTAYQKQPEQEPYAALNQSNTQLKSNRKWPEPETDTFLKQEMSESSKVIPDSDYQDMHDYEMSIQMN